jgi:hypothetical protein
MCLTSAIIDDLASGDLFDSRGTRWKLVTDQVMGGASEGSLRREIVAGRPALRLRGDISLENNGGFVQAALDLTPNGSAVDASGWRGIAISVHGNGAAYNLHLRTTQLDQPWQSYRQSFDAPREWRCICLPFADFVPYRTDAPLDTTVLRRLGIVAIGRKFAADIAIAGVRLYG